MSRWINTDAHKWCQTFRNIFLLWFCCYCCCMRIVLCVSAGTNWQSTLLKLLWKNHRSNKIKLQNNVSWKLFHLHVLLPALACSLRTNIRCMCYFIRFNFSSCTVLCVCISAQRWGYRRQSFSSFISILYYIVTLHTSDWHVVFTPLYPFCSHIHVKHFVPHSNIKFRSVYGIFKQIQM